LKATCVERKLNFGNFTSKRAQIMELSFDRAQIAIGRF
jgi:hypothetical protein